MEILLILYSVWAIYSGYQFVNARVPALQKPGAAYAIARVILGTCVGYVIGGFTFLKWVFIALFNFTRVS